MSARMSPRSSSSRLSAGGAEAAAAATALSPAITFDQLRDDPRVKVYVRKADEALAEIGYTEHGERHVGLVAHIAYNTLKRLGYPAREAELAAIAGYLHDLGNAGNREQHAQTGAAMAMQTLTPPGIPHLQVVRRIG